MTEREIFWHNYRLMRVKMRDASPSEWESMKMVAKVGIIGYPMYILALVASKGFKDCAHG